MPDSHEADAAHQHTLEFMFGEIQRDPNSAQALAYIQHLHEAGWTTTQINDRLGTTKFDATTPQIPTIAGNQTPSNQPNQSTMETLFIRYGSQAKAKRPVRPKK